MFTSFLKFFAIVAILKISKKFRTFPKAKFCAPSKNWLLTFGRQSKKYDAQITALRISRSRVLPFFPFSLILPLYFTRTYCFYMDTHLEYLMQERIVSSLKDILYKLWRVCTAMALDQQSLEKYPLKSYSNEIFVLFVLSFFLKS